MTRYSYTVFAQAYGQNAYNTCDYNCTQGTGATSTGSNGSSSPLANTGIALVGIATIACLIIFVALMVRMSGRRRRANDAAARAKDTSTTGTDHA